MHPDLITGLPIKTYGFCMALGFLAAWQVLAWLCRRTGRQPEPLSNLLMLMLFSGIIGARLEYVREFWSREFAVDPLSVFKVWQGGRPETAASHRSPSATAWSTSFWTDGSSGPSGCGRG